MDVVISRLAALRDIPPEAKDLAWTSRANLLAWAHIHEGAYEQARQAFDDAQSRSGAQLSTLLGRCMIAISVARQGKLSEAGQLAREVLRVAQQRGAVFGGVACMAATALAEILYEADEVEGARELLAPRVAAIEQLTPPGFVLQSLATLANCNWLAGHEDQALACVNRLEAYALRYRFDRILAHALGLRLRRHLLRDEMQEAMGCVHRIEMLMREHAGDGSVATRIGSCLDRARLTWRFMAATSRRLPGCCTRKLHRTAMP
ncbi:hypothetical protein QTI66_36545 [Variovorax sp. J22R133]|nr:hypothetical protein [Variovorax sp. J22R133]MDM0117623.1 hypothetical protein [Variovorax sp. J22R133]